MHVSILKGQSSPFSETREIRQGNWLTLDFAPIYIGCKILINKNKILRERISIAAHQYYILTLLITLKTVSYLPGARQVHAMSDWMALLLLF
jgi:hypothetical protein